MERKELAPPFVPAQSDDPLFHFPESTECFTNEGDYFAPARATSAKDPFAAARRGAVNDFYFNRNEARAKAAERDALEARFAAAAAAAGGASEGCAGARGAAA